MTDDLPERLRADIRQILTETCRGEIHAATAGIMDLYASLIQRLEGEREEALAGHRALQDLINSVQGDPWKALAEAQETLRLATEDTARRPWLSLLAKAAARTDAAEQALSASQKEVEAKTQALIAAEGWFRDYAQQHRAKGTADGNLKAQTNEDRADHLRSALQTGGKEHG